MKKRTPGHLSTKKATAPWQGLSIDFAFTRKASKDTKDTARSMTYKVSMVKIVFSLLMITTQI